MMTSLFGRVNNTYIIVLASQLAFYVNLHRAVIGPSATLTGRWRPDIDLRRMLTGLVLRMDPRLAKVLYCSFKCKYSWLSLSRTRLSRITAYLEVKIWSLPKHENRTTGKKYCGKEEKLLLRSNFSSFPQYFQYISNFRSLITHIFVKCG